MFAFFFRCSTGSRESKAPYILLLASLLFFTLHSHFSHTLSLSLVPVVLDNGGSEKRVVCGVSRLGWERKMERGRVGVGLTCVRFFLFQTSKCMHFLWQLLLLWERKGPSYVCAWRALCNTYRLRYSDICAVPLRECMLWAILKIFSLPCFSSFGCSLKIMKGWWCGHFFSIDCGKVEDLSLIHFCQ